MNGIDSKLHFLQLAQNRLVSAIAKLTAARNDTSFGRYVTLLNAIIDYVTYQIYLQTAKDLSLDLLVDPENSTLADWKAALAALMITLENNGVSVANGWDKDNGIRVKEAYKAVWKITNKIAITLAEGDNVSVNDGYKLRAMVQFFDSFGGTDLSIVAEPNPNNAQIYAITNSTGRVVSLYNQPDPLLQVDINAGRNYGLHTAENLVHEFGHVLDFRTQNEMYDTEWQLMRNQFGELIVCGVDANNEPIRVGSLSRGFDIGDGWNIAKRQNKLDLSKFNNCSDPTDIQICQGLPIKDAICFELEIERIADMFLFWVYSDDSNYVFISDDRGEALSNFANGGAWSRGNTNLTNKGFLGWIEEVGGLN